MPDRICSVEGCETPARSQRTMCARHARILAKPRPRYDPFCSVADCGRPATATGLCGAHYARHANGNLNPDVPVRPQGLSIEERFWAAVDMSAGDDACWLWTAYCNKKRRGYGVLNVAADGQRWRSLAAHRVSWEIANGQPIPPGLSVLHSCDNPPCVNPAHLRIGTAADNARDAVERNRFSRQRGELSGKARLTAADVLAIRAAAENGDSHRSIAERFGVSTGYVGCIVQRRRWAHL